MLAFIISVHVYKDALSFHRTGVKKLQGVKDALKCCPEMRIVDGSDLTNYRAFSEKIHEVLKGFTAKLEKLVRALKEDG